MAQALDDLGHYNGAGVDCLVLENSHDLPSIKPPLPDDSVALMTQIAREVQRAIP